MKDKEFKDMTLDELLHSNLSLEDVDEIIEWDYQVETKTEENRRDEKRGLYPQYEDCSN
jgi:hypothetical protein